MKMTKGKTPSMSGGSAPSTDAHGSRNVNTGFSNRGKVKNNEGGHVSGDSRKSVGCSKG